MILPKFGKVSPATPFMTVSRPGRMLLELTPADCELMAPLRRLQPEQRRGGIIAHFFF
jgi:hypothetical protein